MTQFDRVVVFVKPRRPIVMIERPNMYITKIQLEPRSLVLYRNNFNQHGQQNVWDLSYDIFLGVRIGPPEVEIRLAHITIFIAFNFRGLLHLNECLDFARRLVPLLPNHVDIINSREPHEWPHIQQVFGFLPVGFRPIVPRVNGHAEHPENLPEAEQLQENDQPEAEQLEFVPIDD